jgi:uncharacterized Zn finger protein
VTATVRDSFTEEVVRQLADPRVHARGIGYHRRGLVSPHVEPMGDVGRVRAVVDGSVPYVVELWAEGGKVGWSCTCPAAEDGDFCKHCVATALAVADLPADGPDAGPDTAEPAADAAGLARYVRGLDRERLVGLVLEAALADHHLRGRLQAEARRQ